MLISIAADNTLFLPLDDMVDKLNSLCKSTEFNRLEDSIHIDEHEIVCPKSFKRLDAQLPDELESDLCVIFTNVAYSNNFFYEDHESVVIASVNNWHLLTDQPVINGLFYFIANILTEELDYVEPHVPNRGCINDELIDKRGIDVGMRAASMCTECRAIVRYQGIDASDASDASDLLALLDIISRAARSGVSVLDLDGEDEELAPLDSSIDLFLCHNSENKDEVRNFNETIKEIGMTTWIDEDDLDPGSDWQSEIEKVIPKVKAAAVCVGSSGFGPWQRMELKGLIMEFVDRGCRVIPVILPSALEVPELPFFLRQFTWLDLRTNEDKGLERLRETLSKPA